MPTFPASASGEACSPAPERRECARFLPEARAPLRTTSYWSLAWTFRWRRTTEFGCSVPLAIGSPSEREGSRVSASRTSGARQSSWAGNSWWVREPSRRGHLAVGALALGRDQAGVTDHAAGLPEGSHGVLGWAEVDAGFAAHRGVDHSEECGRDADPAHASEPRCRRETRHVRDHAATECDEGFVAVDIGSGFAECAAVDELSGSAGAVDNTDVLAEIDICAPRPPQCSTWGWLEPAAEVPIPGIECEGSIPDESWLDVPPEPTCEDIMAATGAGSDGTGGNGSANTIVLTPLGPMDTTSARPVVSLPELAANGGNPSSSGSGGAAAQDDAGTFPRRSGGCSVGEGAPRTLGLSSLLLGLASLVAGRRRRSR